MLRTFARDRFLAHTQVIWQQSYYISSAGNDSNDGLTISTPWLTVAKVNTITTHPEYPRRFRCGDLWREEGVFPASNLTFEPYGVGAPPKIYGSDVSSSWTLENYTTTPTITKVQDHVLQSGTTSVTASFPNTPTQGNLEIACLSCTGSGAGISSAAMSGFTCAISAVEGTGHGFTSIWYKVAGASESKNVVATITTGTGANLVIEEWSGLAAPVADKTAYTNDAGSTVSSQSTGTTATTTSAIELCIAFVNQGNTTTAQSWSNSFTDEYSPDTTAIALGSYITSTTGTYTTTLSWTTARRASGCIATFKSSTTVPLYYATQAADPLYLWFIATDTTIHSGAKTVTKDLLGHDYDWWFDAGNSRLYIYSASDPLTHFTSVEISSTTRDRGLWWGGVTERDGITVSGFEIAFVTGAGIVVRSNSMVINNVVHHLGLEAGGHSYGVEVNAGSNTRVANNIIHDTWMSGIFLVASYDPYICSNNIIENNTVYDCKEALIQSQTETSTVTMGGNIIRYNTLYHSTGYVYETNFGFGIRIYGKSGVTADAYQIYYNSIFVQKSGIFIDTYTTNPVLYNNAVISTTGKGIYIFNTGVSGVTLKNNISTAAGLYALQVVDKTCVSVCDYNCWYAPSGTSYAHIGSTDYLSTGFATFKTDTGWEAHGLWQDPTITSAVTPDFHLQNGSPCINAGVSVSLTKDYAGATVGNPPEIGALEK